MTAKTELTAVFTTASGSAKTVPSGGWTPSTSGTYSGKVIITSLEVNAPNGDNATFTATF